MGRPPARPALCYQSAGEQQNQAIRLRQRQRGIQMREARPAPVGQSPSPGGRDAQDAVPVVCLFGLLHSSFVLLPSPFGLPAALALLGMAQPGTTALLRCITVVLPSCCRCSTVVLLVFLAVARPRLRLAARRCLVGTTVSVCAGTVFPPIDLRPSADNDPRTGRARPAS
jgi:hypothetical protein